MSFFVGLMLYSLLNEPSMEAMSLPDVLIPIFGVNVSAALSWECQDRPRAPGEEITFMKVRDTVCEGHLLYYMVIFRSNVKMFLVVHGLLGQNLPLQFSIV